MKHARSLSEFSWSSEYTRVYPISYCFFLFQACGQPFALSKNSFYFDSGQSHPMNPHTCQSQDQREEAVQACLNFVITCSLSIAIPEASSTMRELAGARSSGTYLYS